MSPRELDCQVSLWRRAVGGFSTVYSTYTTSGWFCAAVPPSHSAFEIQANVWNREDCAVVVRRGM